MTSTSRKPFTRRRADAISVPFSLDLHGNNHDLQVGETTPDHPKKIANSCAGGRGNHGHPLRQIGKRFLASLVEKPLCGKLLFELLKGKGKSAYSQGLYVIEHELVLPSRFVHGDSSLGNDLHAVLGDKPETASLHPKHDRPDLTLLILQGHVKVPGSRGAEIGDLPFHPDKFEMGFKKGPDFLRQGGDGMDTNPWTGCLSAAIIRFFHRRLT